MADQPRQLKPEESTASASMKDVLGGVANVVSIATSAAFVLSVIHEQAYFLVVGEKFQNIASLTDYLTNVLDWLPAAVAGLVVYFVGAFLIAGVTEAKQGRASVSAADDAKAAPNKPAREEVLGPTLSRLISIAFFGGLGVLFYLISDPASRLWLLALTFFCVWTSVCLLVFADSDPSRLFADGDLRR